MLLTRGPNVPTTETIHFSNFVVMNDMTEAHHLAVQLCNVCFQRLPKMLLNLHLFTSVLDFLLIVFQLYYTQCQHDVYCITFHHLIGLRLSKLDCCDKQKVAFRGDLQLAQCKSLLRDQETKEEMYDRRPCEKRIGISVSGCADSVFIQKHLENRKKEL